MACWHCGGDAPMVEGDDEALIIVGISALGQVLMRMRAAEE